MVGNMSNLTSFILRSAKAVSNNFTFKSLLFSIARAIAVYKSISNSFCKISFCSLISDIFLMSSFADLFKKSKENRRAILLAQDANMLILKINKIFIIFRVTHRL